MEEIRTITLLREAYKVVPLTKRMAGGFTTKTYSVEAPDIWERLTSYDKAKDLTEDLYTFIYKEVYNECEDQANSGDLLYSDKELTLFIPGGQISVRAMYCEAESTSDISLSISISSLPDEDEHGNEIEYNVQINEMIELLESFEFSRKMNDQDSLRFEGLQDRAHEIYRRLHPED